MAINDVIKARRTIRKFNEYIVSDEDIEIIIDAARWAPSWANTQCWEFIAVRDKEKIRKITDLYSENNPAKAGSYEASIIIVGCVQEKKSGYKNNEPRTTIAGWEMFDLGMAFQNMSLQIHDMGLGSVIVGSINHSEIEKILEVPRGYRVVAAMPVGKPNEEKNPPRRREIDELIHYEKF